MPVTVPPQMRLSNAYGVGRDVGDCVGVGVGDGVTGAAVGPRVVGYVVGSGVVGAMVGWVVIGDAEGACVGENENVGDGVAQPVQANAHCAAMAAMEQSSETT